MLNQDKYKTAEERVRAFRNYCRNRNKMRCEDCQLRQFRKDETCVCFAHWLALEAEEEEPEPCYGCGSPLTDRDIAYKAEQEGRFSGYAFHCVKCGFRTPYFRSKGELVAAHNRVARAVRAAKESEVKR